MGEAKRRGTYHARVQAAVALKEADARLAQLADAQRRISSLQAVGHAFGVDMTAKIDAVFAEVGVSREQMQEAATAHQDERIENFQVIGG